MESELRELSSGEKGTASIEKSNSTTTQLGFAILVEVGEPHAAVETIKSGRARVLGTCASQTAPRARGESLRLTNEKIVSTFRVLHSASPETSDSFSTDGCSVAAHRESEGQVTFCTFSVL